MNNDISTKFIMDVIVNRTITYLKEEVNVNLKGEGIGVADTKRLDLKQLTALMTIGGNVNMNIIFSFDEDLIETIFTVYTEEIDILPEERLESLEETAGDIINIIIGNATADLTTPGQVISISPPVVLPSAKSIIRYKNTKFHGRVLHTDHGDMSLLFMEVI